MPKKYLIVPSPPTPNGRLHLGHMAGVYLPLDIFTRVLRQHGETVFFIGSTDAYDSYVSLFDVGQQECIKRVLDMHSNISQDLRLLAIDMDRFSCPLDTKWHDIYVKAQVNLFRTLVALGKVQCVSESYLEEVETGLICSGGRVAGQCPHCFVSVTGFVCEGCGAINSPEHLICPSAVSGMPTCERQYVSQFFNLSCDTRNYLIARIATRCVSNKISYAPLKFLAQKNPLVRLTYAANYGLSLKGFSEAEKVFNYSGFADYIFAGELYKHLTGDKVNPFERKADFVTVGMCGFDNALSSLVFESAVAHESLIWKCIDHPIISSFLTFEGSKFSTSRKHGVWVCELLSCKKVDRDVLRYYLSSICPEESSRAFSVEQYIQFNNIGPAREFYNSIQHAHELLTVARPIISTQIYCPPDLIELFFLPWSNADLNNLSVSSVIKGMESWVAQYRRFMGDQQGALIYLYGLSILAYPVLPGVATVLWTGLGLTGLPSLTEPPLEVCYHCHVLSLPILDRDDIAFSIHYSQTAE